MTCCECGSRIEPGEHWWLWYGLVYYPTGYEARPFAPACGPCWVSWDLFCRATDRWLESLLGGDS